MTLSDQGLTSTNLLAATSDLLERRGYRRITEDSLADWGMQNARLFEDVYSIVAVVLYDTWRELLQGWSDAQGALVELMSRYIPRSEAKAWDGYVVLLTPSVIRVEDRATATEIQYDTKRVRKLLVTGDNLRGLPDIERALMPLLPLPELSLTEQESALAMLPRLLGRKNLPEDAVSILIDAFQKHEPLLERLHEHLTST